jgi:hypothetical protein
VFIALGAVPALASIIAGAVLISALAVHEIIPLCAARDKSATTTAATTFTPITSPHTELEEGKPMLELAV